MKKENSPDLSGESRSWGDVSLAVHLSGIRMLQSWETGFALDPALKFQDVGWWVKGFLIPCWKTVQCVVQMELMHQF